MLDWNDYPILLAVARSKSLYRAAQNLDVAVSTVTRRVAQIEQRAGLALFVKSDAGYLPTSAGAALIAKAQEMEHLTQAAEADLATEHSRAQQKLRISASEVIAPFFVARHMPALQAACPAHEIILTVSDQSPSAGTQDFDISLWPSTPSNEDLFGRKLTDLNWALYGAQGAPQSGGSVRFFGRDGVDKINPRRPKAAQGAGVASNSLLLAAAVAGAGAGSAYLPCVLGAHWSGLTPLSAPDQNAIGELWAIYRKADRETPHIRAAVKVLVAAAQKDRAVFLGQETA